MSTGNSEPPRVTVTSLSEIVTPPDRPRWLWPQRIPLGSLTLLAGEPQAGKSYLTLDLAARVSRGGPWPGELVELDETGEQQTASNNLGPGSVLLICFEDSWRDTIRTRLNALGADWSKIHCLPFGESQPTDMRIEMLQQNLYKLHDCRLIVIDPISAFLNELGGSSGSQGRRLVYLLAESVRFRETAMVLVTHLRASKGKALHLPSGNDALIRAARAAWLLTNDDSNLERRLLLSIKNNLGPLPSGLAFTFEPVGDGQFAQLQWDDEPVLMSADDFLRDRGKNQTPPRDHKLCDAVEWLKGLLHDGRSVPAAEVQQLAKARGISYGTLRRAFCELGCESLPPDSEQPFRWQLGGRTAADQTLPAD